MASKRRVRYNHCTRKRAYATLEEAKQVLYNMKQYSKNMTGIRVYKCQFGNHYHIGHNKNSTYRATKDKPFKPKY